MSKVILNGITWGHSRGITPLLAFSQRFSELYPNVEVNWRKRTLQEFADFPIEKLTTDYDLLIIDHPWVGCAAATKCVLPLEEYLPEAYLDDQVRNSVGYSHLSYHFKGHQWALAIDAATPVASYRKDLFEKHEANVPRTWNDVLDLAKDGKVAVPAIPIDILMNFYMFCIAHGREPFQDREAVIDNETGVHALETMRELYTCIDEKMFTCNPIAIAELMSNSDAYWYCPFAYGYSNYARKGYSQNTLTYTDLVLFNDVRLRSTLGGTGLAVSVHSKHQEWALKFAELIVSGECQSTLYTEAGGQPGHRSAWLSNHLNLLTNKYFSNTLPALDRAYVRPRYNGYLHFQDHAGDPVQKYLLNGGDPVSVLDEINTLYVKSLAHDTVKLKSDV